MPRLLTMTFTTSDFVRSSSWQFEASPYRTAPKGPPHLSHSMTLARLLDTTPPSLLTTAACSGLRPTPDFRPRRALLHLSYSCAPPFGPAMLVTHVESPGGISPP